MKYILPILTFWLTVNLSAQITPSSCTAPDSIKARYRADADRLTVLRMTKPGSGYENTVPLHKPWADSLLGCILAVYNATSLPARDTVIRQLNIHTFPYPSVDEITIYADKSEGWMQQLKAGNLNTGNSSIDDLIDTYGLTINSYFQFSSFDAVYFKTAQSASIEALAKKFRAISSVKYAQAEAVAGDGARITADSFTSNYTCLTFSYGWGDCPAGCIYRRYWHFRIYNNCDVEFTGSNGSNNLPKQSIRKLKTTVFSISPNPFASHIEIKGISNICHYTLYDQSGRNILSGESTGSIDGVDNLPAGVYLLYLKEGNNFQMEKLIKL